ncbi:MAG: DUF3472 domain-containing protein [Siphonobacter aquaeclarae]|nr:DUF3472 domain-containing protein [Siphonobacter aquaeclarae]
MKLITALIVWLFGMNAHDDNKLTVPTGGNTWVKNAPTRNAAWTDTRTVSQTYFRLAQPGKLKVSVIWKSSPKARLSLKIGNKSMTLTPAGEKETYAGEWDIAEAGYLHADLQGISKESETFGEIEALGISGSAVSAQTAFVKDNEGNFFYWGRRGPSVHLSYTLPADQSFEYFYNEVTVPEGQDVQGSYFMANGFGEGYFGMQVNSPTERRVLFSVWSPFTTDDPKKIPEEQRINMLGKGEGVYTGEFGNEGSGGQSYLKFNWKAGQTYRFLLRGVPSDETKSTAYTAWFFAPEEKKWRLIASFRRPQTNTHLKRFHSFLENFIPEFGDQGRRVYFGNQWAKTTGGKWIELTEAKFTADATGRKGYWLDYGGGEEKPYFFLRNCGFFNETTPINSLFHRPAGGKEPEIGVLP